MSKLSHGVRGRRGMCELRPEIRRNDWLMKNFLKSDYSQPI